MYLHIEKNLPKLSSVIKLSSCVLVTTRDAIAEESYVTDQVTALCHTNEIHIFVREEEGGGKGFEI